MKITGRLARLESRHAPSSQAYQVVIYDAATGLPLPGHEPRADVSVRIWIPDNGRGPAAVESDVSHEGHEGARCD